MSTRLVLRIERNGRLLGSWSLGDEPLEMKMVDLATGAVVARFTASAEALGMPGGLDEVPHALPRLKDDDFTMPLPEPTRTGPGGPPTEEAPRGPRALRNLASSRSPPAEVTSYDGLTSELVDVEPQEVTDDLDLDDLQDDGGSLSLDEVPVALRRGAGGRGAGDRPTELTAAGLTGELRTATIDLPRPTVPYEALPFDDPPSLTRPSPLPRASSTDPEQTPRALVKPAPNRVAPPPPAEVWAQKRGEWKSVGHLVPGQRVSTLGGWVRLAPDGRLVVSSGTSLAGTATLIDGRMMEIAAGQDFLALPPGSSVMLAVGDRGIYVRSEPLPGSAGAH